MTDSIRFNAQYEIWGNRIALRAIRATSKAVTIDFQEHVDGEVVEPFFYLEMEEAQALSNSLWAAGIRPEQSKQAQGAFEAQEKHLDDMRLIAMNKLKIEVSK